MILIEYIYGSTCSLVWTNPSLQYPFCQVERDLPDLVVIEVEKDINYRACQYVSIKKKDLLDSSDGVAYTVLYHRCHGWTFLRLRIAVLGRGTFNFIGIDWADDWKKSGGNYQQVFLERQTRLGVLEISLEVYIWTNLDFWGRRASARGKKRRAHSRILSAIMLLYNPAEIWTNNFGLEH